MNIFQLSSHNRIIPVHFPNGIQGWYLIDENLHSIARTSSVVLTTPSSNIPLWNPCKQCWVVAQLKSELRNTRRRQNLL